VSKGAGLSAPFFVESGRVPHCVRSLASCPPIRYRPRFGFGGDLRAADRTG